MGNKNRRRILSGLLALCMIGSCVCSTLIPGLANNESMGSASSVYTADEYTSEMISHNYTCVSAKYSAPAYQGETIVCPVASAITDIGTAQLTDETYDYPRAEQVLNATIKDVVSFTVEVPKTAQYLINFEYLSYDTSILPIELSLQIDGEFPFYECRSLAFETTWVSDGEKSFDRYNNEIITVPNKLIRWESKYLMDSSYRYSEALPVELTAGTHSLTITMKEGSVLFGAVLLCAPTTIPEYTGSVTAEGAELIVIQAEEFTYRNDSSVHAVAEYDTGVDPYVVKDTVLNTIDSDSFSDAGQSVSYEIIVQTAGYYYIAMNYRQSDKTDFPVFVDFTVDGEIPNTAFRSYPLDYTTKYRTETMTDESGTALSLWLNEGTHLITLTINMENIRHVLEGLDVVMSGINDLALEITKVAGTNSDKYRDLKLSKYIPDLEDQLYGYAQLLYDLQDSVLMYTDGKSSIAVMSSMSIAAEQLISLAKNPDEIPYRIAELSTSVNSANHYLANTIDSLIDNNLAIDRIYLYQENAELPDKPGFFASIFMSIKRFFSSFTDQAYSSSNTDPDHLQVWVSRSTQHVQIMQKMIDEYFTPETGIEVDISVMPDQYKLVLSNTSGDAPDIATGINYTIPYELAIRNALVDLSKFDGFQETASVYEPGMFITSVIDEGIYAIPETMNFWVLFYRTDIIEKLNLEIPDTMQEVIDMLPELQMRGLNFYYPTAGMLQMKIFHGTCPLIFQNNGYLYFRTADQGTALGEENAIDGFTYLTELFTIYDMPTMVDRFYQHFRNGDLPIGIADLGTYNLLINAAPELKNSWDIALMPGTEQEDQSITRYSCGGAESTVIFKSDEEREAKAWEFVQWWSSTEVQALYGQTLQITYGDEYMWSTANMEAFMELPWDSADKQVIAEQSKWVYDIARIPGTYMMEREMSNAFNDIIGGETAQTRLDQAVKTINREFQRKLEEFSYIDSEGNVIETYTIPTLDSVKKMLGREE